MAWLLLITAGMFEIGMALGLKQSDGFTRLMPTILMILSGALSFFLLSLAMRSLPVGIAYPVWTGIGAAGTAIVGILWLGESRDAVKLVSLVLLIAGVAGLRISEGG